MKYGIWWQDTYKNINEWLKKDITAVNEGFNDEGKFATFDINEVFQKLEKTINKYRSFTYWKFEAREK